MPTIFLLQIAYDRSGTDWVVAECSRAALEDDIRGGQYDRILTVLEVNREEGWNRDISLSLAEDIAAKREPLSENVVAFIGRHAPALAREIDRRAA